MGLNSCIYECAVTHCRTRPRRHHFKHDIYMLYLDLDEIDAIAASNRFFSRSRFNLFNFCDADHMEFTKGATVKENLVQYLTANGIHIENGRYMLLTHVRVLGHVFNPISVYFCFDADNNPVCAVPEVGNTFGEIKPYFIGSADWDGRFFASRQAKYYYVSPFIDLDVDFDFKIKIPGENLLVQVDDIQGGEKFMYATMTGARRELTEKSLLKYSLGMPFVTLKVIGLIHFHAVLLWLKGLPYRPKESQPEMQREVLRAWRKRTKLTTPAA